MRPLTGLAFVRDSDRAVDCALRGARVRDRALLRRGLVFPRCRRLVFLRGRPCRGLVLPRCRRLVLL
eukprot:15463018-Alexandrium_andersonii.AAC.1